MSLNSVIHCFTATVEVHKHERGIDVGKRNVWCVSSCVPGRDVRSRSHRLNVSFLGLSLCTRVALYGTRAGFMLLWARGKHCQLALLQLHLFWKGGSEPGVLVSQPGVLAFHYIHLLSRSPEYTRKWQNCSWTGLFCVTEVNVVSIPVCRKKFLAFQTTHSRLKIYSG